MKESRFTLKERKWYAADFIADDVPGSMEGGYGYSPIFIVKLRKKKTGSSIFGLEFFHANYPQGVNSKAYELQTIHRGKSYILTKTTTHDPVRFMCVHNISEKWARKHFTFDKRKNVDEWLMEYMPQ
jgi:hypothetical protein